MDKTIYKSIRNKKDFLYQYFIKSGGKAIGDQQFSTFLSIWIMSMNMQPQQGIPQIVNFLDKKFA